MMATAAETTTIDDGLYSRQRYVLGEQAMKRIASSSVLISGLSGLGAEVAKNVALAGPRRLTLHDASAPSFAQQDLSTHFYSGAGDRDGQRQRRIEATANRIAELNPYVIVDSDVRGDLDAEFLRAYQCVVLVDAPLDAQLRVNDRCRAVGVPFIACSVRGVFASAFADFGSEFAVHDRDGEEPKEFLLSSVSNGNPAVCCGFPNQRHGLEDGDLVSFREVGGMPSICDVGRKLYRVKVLTPFAFAVDVDTSAMAAHTGGGTAIQARRDATVSFLPLSSALSRPKFAEVDLSKLGSAETILAAFRALDQFRNRHSDSLPSPWSSNDADEFASIARGFLTSGSADAERLLRMFSYTCWGAFQPMVAFLGGVVGQEVIKAATGKFTPLDQWLCLDMAEVVPPLDTAAEQCAPRGQYSDGQAVCIGWEAVRRLAEAKMFMVGAGAIGCELLKNFALMGVATAKEGKVVVTDPDLIEKSNLNRQFLFRNSDIRKPKSTTAAEAAKAMNPRMRIQAALDKVCGATEEVYSDEFFESLDVAVNALDNVAARLYMDGRCVTNQRPLLESGTLGTKGHVQVIVPHLTENYGSQRDPAEKDIPFCTVHSFPNHIDHCIQWARDHFAKQFADKPAEAAKALANPSDFVEKARQAGLAQYKTVHSVTKLLASRPRSYRDCVVFAMLKFRSYFDSGIQRLLDAFPVDAVTSEGGAFWAPPKRPPKTIRFDAGDPSHIAFVRAASYMWASVHGIAVDTSADIAALCRGIALPPAKAKAKKVVTEETKEKAEEEAPLDLYTQERFDAKIDELTRTILECKAASVAIHPAEFEKDDDSNGHVDFVSTTANLRAGNYSIQQADRLEVKRIAGRIIPAIATTTAAVSGLVACELVKVLMRAPAGSYRNAFLNLALPLFSFSEPAPPAKQKLAEGVFFTVWDSWTFKSGSNITLEEFVAHYRTKMGLEVTSIIQGQRMVFSPLIPAHASRLKQKMGALITRAEGQKFVELVVSFEDSAGNDVETPSIRFFF